MRLRPPHARLCTRTALAFWPALGLGRRLAPAFDRHRSPAPGCAACPRSPPCRPRRPPDDLHLAHPAHAGLHLAPTPPCRRRRGTHSFLAARHDRLLRDPHARSRAARAATCTRANIPGRSLSSGSRRARASAPCASARRPPARSRRSCPGTRLRDRRRPRTLTCCPFLIFAR